MATPKKPSAVAKAKVAKERVGQMADPKGMLQDFLAVYGIGKKRKQPKEWPTP